MKWGIANSKVSMGGSGDAELNLAYGLTPPSDTTKIWVRTDKTPTSVEITTEPTWSDVIETSAVKTDLEDITESVMCRAGEYLYLFGGIKDGVGLNIIRRYNTITNDIETLDIALPYAVAYCGACCYNDYIFLAYATSYDGSNYYFQPKVLKFNWKTNRICPTKSYYSTSIYGASFRWMSKVFNIGSKMFIVNGKGNGSASYLGSSNSNYIYRYVNDLTGQFQSAYLIYDMKTEKFETQQITLNHQNNSICQTINKTTIDFSGNTSSGYSPLSILGVDKITSLTNNNLRLSYQTMVNVFGRNNIILTTNSKLYICGGQYGSTSNNVSANPVDTIACYDYSTNLAPTTLTATLPYALNWSSCQFDCQTSYGATNQYLVKVENKLSISENALVIIPDIENEKTYTISSVENVDYKIPINNVYIGNSNGKAEMVRCYVYDETTNRWLGINCDDYTEQTKENISLGNTYYEGSSVASLTSYIVCNVGDLLIASVIARDNGNETASSGWELIGRSQTGGSNNQTLAFYKKIATSKVESITITQSSSNRIYITLVNFVGKADATIGTFDFKANARVCDLTLPDGKLCVVSGSTALWSGSSWSYYDPYDSDFNDFSVVEYPSQPRLATWIDYGKGGARTIGNNADTSGNTTIAGYVVIEDGNVLI